MSLGELTNGSRVFLSTLRPERRERQLAIGAVVLSAAVFALAAPFARVQLAVVWPFIPIYESALVICDLLTAALLLGQYAILRSPSLLVLAGGYLLSGFMAVAHLMSFPGLFSATGLLGAREQTTAWLYMLWHGGFPLVVMAYAFLKRDEIRPAPLQRQRQWLPPLCCIAASLLVACALTALATVGHDALPRIMQGSHHAPAMAPVVTLIWAANLAALGVLYSRRPHSMLDLWLIVVVCAWLFDIALAALLNVARFDVGFYAGRIYGLIASSFVLIALTFENVKLYARIVKALDSERLEHRLVQQKTAQLNEAKAQLEERVAARTAALAASNRDLMHEVAERKRAEEALKRSREELREVAAISTSAREQEKRRLARELHDELAQTLATLRLEVDLLDQRTPAGGDIVTRKLAEMRTLLDEAVASTRRIASDLRPLVLDDLGLVAATQWLVHNFQQRHGIECSLFVDPTDLDLEDPHATAAFRIMQESLANVARHARASKAEVRLIREDGQIVLEVRDNGTGFDISSPRKANSFGLAGLRERTYLVEGKFSIESSPGHGTTIEVRIPLPTAQERELP
jgi:two-component system, NarL family, sensor histidine kinase UhpB